jgi:phage terminase large subunit GpA-like protein
VKDRWTVREWIKTRVRNEALDLEVDCLAAIYILGPAFVKALPERAAALAREGGVSETMNLTPTPPPLRRRGWVDSRR